jgi:hypothetical protein
MGVALAEAGVAPSAMALAGLAAATGVSAAVVWGGFFRKKLNMLDFA